MENFPTPKMVRRGCSETNLTRSCSGTSFNLDELMFKSPSLTMTPKRKRKRHRTDEDSISLTSLSSVDIHIDEPKKKRRSSLAKITSLSNLLSPKNSVRKVGQALQKSLSLRNLMSPSNNTKTYKGPQPTPPKRRESTFWVETVKGDAFEGFSPSMMERQEAIFELYKNEEDMIEDLIMVKSTYHDVMAKLKLMNESELKQIFGAIETFQPIHLDLVEGLREQRRSDGITDCIGQVLLDWVPQLDSYIPYCANQVYAKALLDMKKQDPAVHDFLQRCQDSPFSRRLDLWSFLDVPRSRLVKYPLLFKSILKLTPKDHPDVPLIEAAMKVVEKIIEEVDRKTGEAKCQFIRSKLEYLDEKTQKSTLIEKSNVILCDGVLKNNRGTKLHVFLFEEILVLTRLASRGQNNVVKYQVYRQPIPGHSLVLDEDGQSKSGSFRSAFTHSNANTNKQMFKVSFRNAKDGQSHTLQANDEHDKRQWVQCIKTVLKKFENQTENMQDFQNDSQIEDGAMRAKRRNSFSLEEIEFDEVDGSHQADKEDVPSPSRSLRSAGGSYLSLSPSSVTYSIRRSLSRGPFNIDSDGEEQQSPMETKPIPIDNVSYRIRRSLRRSSGRARRGSTESTSSSTFSGSPDNTDGTSGSCTSADTIDFSHTELSDIDESKILATPEQDITLNTTAESVDLDTSSSKKGGKRNTPKTITAGKKRKSLSESGATYAKRKSSNGFSARNSKEKEQWV